MNNVALAFALTIFAGLSTGIGSAIGFFAKTTNTRLLAISLGFSAGVMLYVSFVEILGKARDALGTAYGEVSGAWVTAAAFFGGIAFIGLIDHFVPAQENPHEARGVEQLHPAPEDRKKTELLRMGFFTALAIGIHNFPEGLATFVATLSDPALGISIAVAIAIHNVPEGIAVSVPIYYATGSRKKAFFYSFLSGLAEPVGAAVGFLLLMRFFNDAVFGVLFAMVAGIMVYISLDELLPTAEKYGEHHLSIYGLIAGMVVMAVSLLLFL